MVLNKKLDKIYKFLTRNRRYNKSLQNLFYRATLLPYYEKTDKVIALLFCIIYTQSQPSMDNIAKFFNSIYNKKDKLETFKNFLILLGNGANDKTNYFQLFNLLKRHPGWGNKTAALFTKTVYHLHNGKYESKLKIWDDAPRTIEKDDILYLPVDIVIENIFKRIKLKNPTFRKINKILQNKYNGEKIEIWDDLWFWGYFTQRVKKKKRVTLSAYIVETKN